MGFEGVAPGLLIWLLASSTTWLGGLVLATFFAFWMRNYSITGLPTMSVWLLILAVIVDGAVLYSYDYLRDPIWLIQHSRLNGICLYGGVLASFLLIAFSAIAYTRRQAKPFKIGVRILLAINCVGVAALLVVSV